MSPTMLFLFVMGYFLLLLGVAWITSRNANNESFFVGNKKSNWILVAFGMIGTSLSGVTFVSVPGGVGTAGFNYFQVIIGYLFGYAVIAYILLPLYYRMNVTSIYSYLEQRLGPTAHKAGSFFFILSRTVGATARLYLVINILQLFILDRLGVPFMITTFVIMLMILLYTFEGGVKTIIYTDTLQTTGMLVGLAACIWVFTKSMQIDFPTAWNLMEAKGYTRIINTDIKSGAFFLKHMLGGMFIAIAMTGLDQEMMQKNISVKTLKGSQMNIMLFTIIMVIVNLCFLFLGGVLYLYAAQHNISTAPDDLFPTIALSDMFSGTIGVVFIIALISALFPSVDGAITSLTSSFCIDILGIQKMEATEKQKRAIRMKVHLAFAATFYVMVKLYKMMNDKLIIDLILKLAGVTYGPLLGMFAFGILTKRSINSKGLVAVCIAAPSISLLFDMLAAPEWYEKKLHVSLGLSQLSESIFHGYKIGNELILINGLLTFLGLWMISSRKEH